MTSNINQDNKKPFTQLFKYMTTENGLKILMFGFTVKVNDVPGMHWVSYQSVIESEPFLEVVREYGSKTDLLLLNFHDQVASEDVTSAYQRIKKLLIEMHNYTVPTHVFLAHDHLVLRMHCPDDVSN